MKYCIAAADKITGIRGMYVGPMSYSEALSWAPDYLDKKTHKYFKVAKYPYATKKHGGGKL